jgi:ATP-binding cassette subfamily C protein CydCD
MYLDARLWAFTLGFRHRIVWAVIIGLLAAAAGVARLALLGWLLAKVFTGTPAAELVGPLLLVAAVMVLRGVLEYGRNMVAHRTAAAVQMALRRRLYDKVVELGPAHFGLQRTGDVILSLVDGVEQLETYFGQYLPQLCVSLLTPIAIFVFAAFLDLPIALVLLVAAVVTLAAPTMFHYWDKKAALSRKDAYGAFAADFLDALQGLATLKAFGQSRQRGDLLAERARAVFKSTMWVLATNALARGITDTGIAVGAAVALGFGAYRVVDGDMSLAVLLVVLMMGVEVFRPLRDLRTVLHQGMVGQSAAGAVLEILEAEPPITDDVASREQAEITPTVAFENVSFAYPDTEGQAHSGLNFSVAAGERIGIVGPSGAGKTTVVKLLLRIYEPQAGTVSIGGCPLKEMSLHDLRRQIAVVSQDTYLFHGTVEDNLRFGKPDATQQEITAAVKAANAEEFIDRLPQGYDTVIGERGLKLSGGQRQRIAIARALLRDAPILVLDEALSAVDAENEAVIQQALDRLMRGRTTLIFAHRLSSVIDTDRILVLGDGHVLEEGNHARLMAQGGAYHRLMAAQAEDTGGARFDLVVGNRLRAGDEEAPARLIDTDPSNAILKAEGLGWAGAFAELLKHIVPWKGRLVLTFIFGVTRVLAFIGVGVAGALVVLAVKSGEPFGYLLLWLAFLAPAAGILHWLESWLAHDMAFRLLAEMRIALFEKLEKLAPAYLLRRRSGDLVSMATEDVETVEFFFAHTVAPAFVAVLIPLVVLFVLVVHGWTMALALLPFLAIVVMSPFMMRNRVDRLGSQAREALGELNAHAADTVQGLAEIVAFEQEQSRGEEFSQLGRNHVDVRVPFFRELTLQTALLEVATGLGGVAVVAAGAQAVASGRLDAGLLPLLTILAMAAFLPVSEISNIGRQLADTLGATRRLHSVHGEPVLIKEGPGVGDNAANAEVPALSTAHLKFIYPGTARPALQDINISVDQGQTVALVGPSGAGKTTLAHLFLRFWDADEGEVRLYGRDLRDYTLEGLRRRIALVAQDTYLFNDTLRANILLARPEASEEELQEAVERAALSEFVAALPDGLDSAVGERGMRLSGGQRQRVAIARAFLKDAAILILDEATSHLDAVSERLVREALDDLMSDRTTVVIAHRLSTIRNADQIIVLDEGRIAEAGRHEELLNAGGLYAHLVARQVGTGTARGIAAI